MRGALSIIVVTIALAGCGETTGSGSTSSESEGVCGINAYGNKLCDEDAAAYCDLIGGSDADDPDTAQFCSDIELAGY